ncbi:uncharacterized protein LOC131149721 [Malania oleifera]|uniref:uncharacterized protein LOC131149721 n=1 Tax=Malania oleifera TaxID=397392 RepID=UPI0025AE7BFD|nr:uncharacterized protein LOC131149721 [Malania oleifera]
MQLFNLPAKTLSSSRLINLILVSSSACLVYIFLSLFLVHSSKLQTILPSSLRKSAASPAPALSLEHIVFGIASSANSWPKRKEFVRLWWQPSRMRGCVFLEHDQSKNQGTDSSNNKLNGTDHSNDDETPPVCISEDTSRFRYTYKNGLRSAIRVAHVVSETVALNHSDVRWFVFGDDDTVFFPENLVKTLSKYDHELWYYIGTGSEIYEQNRLFSFEMAFGGAGFAISYPLAKVLAKVFDSCLERYPHLYGSDGRIYSCLAELGVGLTREPGFHQMDLQGDVFGLLAAHPPRPLVSLHHLDQLEPIFPNMTFTAALRHLFTASAADPHRLLHHSVCYDRWFLWTISLSWGYALEVYQGHLFLPDLLPPLHTFRQWKRGTLLARTYTFNTREPHPDPCRRPSVFFLHSVSTPDNGSIATTYRRLVAGNCSFDAASPRKLDEIRVFSHKLHLDVKQLQAPRRHCCEVLPSSAGKVMEIAVRECGEEELIRMHP